TGKDLRGRTIDLARFKGKVVLIDYWATWCEPCQKSFPDLKKLYAKYGAAGFTIIGINLDSEQADMVKFLKDNRLPWYQIHEKGGLDSRPALQMGILTLPTKILIDQKGRVVARNIHTSQIETELKKLLRK
ncbi:MAG: TlpA family protein disulfide reductase, partial [Planctomycetales bacterium]